MSATMSQKPVECICNSCGSDLTISVAEHSVSKVGWQPGPAPLMTRWGREVNPATSAPHPEYPRPDLAREKWLSLNGLWQFGVIAE